ncbi:MAG TPA: LamG-like jellyroll fold domain-containing protein [Flavobacterium sp.]|jgi:hypothetical protein
MRKFYTFLFAIAFFTISSAQVQIGSSNYPTLKSAVDAINNGSHTGTITVSITGNTTETQEIYINPSGLNAANYNSIKVSPSGGAARTILLTNDSEIIFFGCENVTFDGLNTLGNSLTLASDSGFSTTVRFLGASNNMVTNCRVLGSGTNGVIFFDSTPIKNNNNNSVIGCDVGPYNSNLPRIGIHMNGANGAITNALIRDNNIYDYTSTIYSSAGVKAGTRVRSFTIENNRFYQTAVRLVANNIAISAVNDEDINGLDRFITGNVIGGANSAGTGMYGVIGNFTGIFLNMREEASTCYINYNTIKNISISESASGDGSYAHFYAINVNKGKSQIRGNLVGSMAGTGSILYSSVSPLQKNIYAIYKIYKGDTEILENNIGGITAVSSVNANLRIYGIYVGNGGDYSNPTVLCSGNTVGGHVANSITTNSTASGAGITGISYDEINGDVRNNTVRNLTGYGGDFSEFSPYGVVGIHYRERLGGINNRISDNTISYLANANTTVMSTVSGIFNDTRDGNTIERNFVHSLNSLSTNPASHVEGIAAANSGADIINNMIALGSSVTQGIRIDGIRTSYTYTSNPGYLNISNNSIYIGGSPTSGNGNTSAFNHSRNRSNMINSNIFVNNRSNSGNASGANIAIKVGPGNENPYFRANVYYGTGIGYILGYVFDTPKSTLAQWNSWSNPASDYGFSANPKFVDPAGTTPNLHINPTLVTIVEGRAFQPPVDDFDQQVRLNLNTSDIGADEGNFTQLTAPVVQSLNVPSPSCTGAGGITVSGTSMLDVTEFKIGNTVFPIDQIIDAGDGVGILVVYPTMAASGVLTLTNPAGTTVGTTNINVFQTPVITLQPQNRTICSTQSTTMSVTATGGTLYQWRRNGVNLTNNAVYSNVTSATLNFTNPPPAEAGTFDVVVTGTGGVCPATSALATLTVGGQPLTLKPSGPTTFCGGGSVTLTPTVASPSRQFDGIDDHITTLGAYDVYSHMTMEFWMKTTNTAPTGIQWHSGKGIVEAKYDQQSFGASLFGNKVAFGMDRIGSEGDLLLLSNAVVNTGEWIHVTITTNSQTTEVKMFINGVLDASATPGTFMNIALGVYEVYIGTSPSGNTFFQGGIDNVRLWNRILSDQEIQASAADQAITNTQQLGLSHSFNETSGTGTVEEVTGMIKPMLNGVVSATRQANAYYDAYFWSNGAQTRTITVSQTGNYSLTAYNGNCANSSNTVSAVLDMPPVTVQASSGFYCSDGPAVTLTASGAEMYTWSPASGLDTTTGNVVHASPTVFTLYTVTGTSANGCTNTYSVPVQPTITRQLEISASQQYIPSGGSVQLIGANGMGNYSWSPSVGLSSISGEIVTAMPTATTTYTVSGGPCTIPASVTIYVLPQQSLTDNALDFDGIDDFVNIPVQPEAISGAFTVAVWVKPSHPTKTMHVFSTRNGANGNTFDIQITNGNKIHGDIGNGASWLTTAADANFTYQPNTWMHIAYVVTPGFYKIYANGNLIQTGSYSGNAVLFNHSTNFITLGKNDGENTLFQGSMDDLSISAVAFADDMMAFAPRYGLPGIVRYGFNEGIAGGSNPTVTILSSDAPFSTYHGHLNNFALNGQTSNWVEGQVTLDQTITFNALADVQYGSGSFNPGATASSGLAVAYQSSDPAVATVSGGTVTVTGIGITQITAMQNGNAFYNEAFASQLLTVTPKEITVANAAAADKVYDRTTSAIIIGDLSGIVAGESVGFAGNGTFATMNAGSEIAVTPSLSLTGPHAGHYILQQPTGLSADITPKPLTTSGSMANDKIYDGTTSATISGTTLNGVISPDVVTISSNAGTFNSAAVGTNKPVAASLTLGGANALNYQLVQPSGLTANITPAGTSAVLSGGGEICVGESEFFIITIAGGAGPFSVIYSDGNSNYIIQNYVSGTAVSVSPTADSDYTLVSVSSPNYTFATSGTASVTVRALTTYYVDNDGDGYDNGFELACQGATVPAGYSLTTFGTDCDDANIQVFQSAMLYVDADNDGFSSGSSMQICYGAQVPSGYIAHPTEADCNDSNAAVNQAHEEILYNGIDDNCDGQLDEGFQMTTQVYSQYCGIILNQIYQGIAVNYMIPNVTAYRFRLTNVTNPVEPVQYLERSWSSFKLTDFARYDYGTLYKIETQLQINGNWLGYYGAACMVTSPAVPQLQNCGGTIAAKGVFIFSQVKQNITGYRFEVTRLTTGQALVVCNGAHYFTFNQIPFYAAGEAYSIRVSVKTTGDWSAFGNACILNTPGQQQQGNPAKENVKAVSGFTAVAYPSPYSSAFGLKLISGVDSDIQVKIYDMLGRTVEVRDVDLGTLESEQFGLNLPSGVYNIVVSQADAVETLRVIKR